MKRLSISLLLVCSVPSCRVPPEAVVPPAARAPASLPAPRLTGHQFEIERRDAIVFSKPARGPALRLDLYVPDCDGPHPFAVVIPGGGWRTGDRHQFDAVAIATTLAEEGIAAAAVSHRRVPASPFPAPIDDCRAATRYLVAHADELDLDAERFCSIGCSSGGHLAALLGTADDEQTPKPACVVALSAPLDFQSYDTDRVSGLQIKLLVDLLGVDQARVGQLGSSGFLAHIEVEARAASPLHWIDASDPPFLLIHGRLDAIVPVGHARRMHCTLTAAGVPSTLMIEEASGHIGYFRAVSPRHWHGAQAPRFWVEMRRFLTARLLH